MMQKTAYLMASREKKEMCRGLSPNGPLKVIPVMS
jgi:hypothetical protein